jgi:hypothetical protein
MKISFKAHQETDREVELSQKELFNLFEMMRREFKEHISYASFRDCYYPSATEKSIIDFCKSHSIDVQYDRDRVNFFTAILQELRNPYQ